MTILHYEPDARLPAAAPARRPPPAQKLRLKMMARRRMIFPFSQQTPTMRSQSWRPCCRSRQGGCSLALMRSGLCCPWPGFPALPQPGLSEFPRAVLCADGLAATLRYLTLPGPFSATQQDWESFGNRCRAVTVLIPQCRHKRRCGAA